MQSCVRTGQIGNRLPRHCQAKVLALEWDTIRLNIKPIEWDGWKVDRAKVELECKQADVMVEPTDGAVRGVRASVAENNVKKDNRGVIASGPDVVVRGVRAPAAECIVETDNRGVRASEPDIAGARAYGGGKC